MKGELEKEIMAVLKTENETTVNDLIDVVASRLGVERYKVARGIYKLWKEERLSMEDLEPPRSIADYVTSTYSLWFWLTTLIVTLTALTIYVLPQNSPYIYLRYVLGAILILYLPGQALIEALYPKKEDLTSLERFALSVGLSLALVPLVGLLLNYTPWGIRLNPIFASISLLTTGLAVTAVVRKYRYHMMKFGVETR